MGLFDLLRPGREESQQTASALEAARHNAPDDTAIGRVVQMLMDAGLDGRGPLRPATSIADAARRRTSDPEEAVERIVRLHVVGGAVGGFVTGLGGFVTMPVALPVNVAEFYVQATRMVGAIATLRGYDVRDPAGAHRRAADPRRVEGRRGARQGRDGHGRRRDHQARARQAAAGRADGGQQGGRLPPDAWRLRAGLLALRSRGAVPRRRHRRRRRRVDDAAHRRAGAGGVPAASTNAGTGRWSQ